MICTEPFTPTAKSMARIQGIPDYPFVTLPHPMGSLTPEQVKERAALAVDQVIAILLGR